MTSNSQHSANRLLRNDQNNFLPEVTPSLLSTSDYITSISPKPSTLFPWYHQRFQPHYYGITVAFSALTLLVERQEGHPACKKIEHGGGGHWLVWMEWRPAGWSVCLPLLIFPCTIKSRSSLLAPAHPGGPGKRAVKRLCVLWDYCSHHQGCTQGGRKGFIHLKLPCSVPQRDSPTGMTSSQPDKYIT